MTEPDALTPRQEERLASYRAGRLDARAREAFEREALADAALAEALYSELGFDALAARGQVPHRWRVPTRVRWAIAAAAVLALALALPHAWRSAAPGGSEPVRGADGGMRALGPVGEVDELPRTFLWHAVPGAREYRVEWFDDAGRRLGTRWVADTVLSAPAPLPGRGEWRLTALNAEGLPVGEPVSARWHVRGR